MADTTKSLKKALGASKENPVLEQSFEEIEGSDYIDDEFASGTPATPSRTRPIGHLDIDCFSINDVVLRIPPNEMKVDKQAFNHEWLTLRTRSSQKGKSGYSISRIGFSVEFKSGSDFADLSRLVAGLRSTPFCVVYSTYLDQVIGRNEHGMPPFIDRKQTSYNFFQPMMLALSSMVFSTLGHEGKSDCIRGTFEFYHFNYRPLTDIIAFKTGPGLNVPGTVWESVMWKKFYQPYIYSPPDWPHKFGTADIYDNRTTTFSWNEFVMVPKGDPAVTESALTLVKSIREGGKSTIDIINNMVSATAGKPTEQKALQNIWNTFYNELVQAGRVPEGTTAWALGDSQAKELTDLMNDLLGPTLKRINSTGQLVEHDRRQLEQLELLLAERLNSIKKAKSQGDAAAAAMAQGGFDRLMEIPVYVNKKDNPTDTTSKKIDVGGRDLYRRRATYNIRHQSTSDYEDGPQVIIQHMTVGFRNNLAVIPMVGYRNPLIQHVGATDITVGMTMNVRNTAMGEGSSGLEALNRIYDTVQLMAQKFKQVPQGFTNLYIKNDFFRLFGLEEFLPERISSETISGMPGRSLVSLELSEADMSSTDTVQDNPEKLNQEFIFSSEGVYKEIWKVLSKHLTHCGDSYGASREEAEYQFFATYNVQRDVNHLAFAGLVDKVRDYLNSFIERAHGKIFNYSRPRLLSSAATGSLSEGAVYTGTILAGGWGIGPVILNGDDESWFNFEISPLGGNALAYSVLMGLNENEPDIGFLPYIDQVKATITSRINGYAATGAWKNGKIPYSSLSKIKPRSLAALKKELEEQYNANKTGQKISSDTNKELNAAVQNQQAGYDLYNKFQRLLGALGVNTYQNQVRGLMDQIVRLYMDLPEFQHIKVQMEASGLGIGLMAFPDFKGSLTSVASWVEGTSFKGNGSLINYDPDCYLWYPSILGGASSPDLGLIDPTYITKAKEHSLTFYDEARGKVNTFFDKRYLQLLGGSNPNTQILDNIKAQWETSQKEEGKRLMELYPPGQTIVNATRDDGRPGKDKIAGPCVKTGGDNSPLVNAYPKGENGSLTIRSPGLIGHIFDFPKFWEDGYSVKPPSPSAASSSSEIAPIDSSSPQVRKGKVFSTRNGPRMTIAEFMASRKITHCSAEEVEAKYNQLLASVAQITDPKTGKPYGRHWGAGTLHSGWGGVSFDFGPPGYGQGGKKGLLMGPPTPEKQRYYYEIGTRAEALGFWWGGRWAYKFGNMENFRDWISPTPIDKRAIKGTGKYSLINTDGVGGMGDFMHVEWAPTKVGKGRVSSARRVTQRPGTLPTVLPTGTGNVAATMSSPILASIQEMQEEQLRGQGEGLMRAYPTFKLYFIEDDSKERLRFGLDDFFSYNAVQSIRVVRDRKIPADLCEIYLTNVSGILSNRKFRQQEMQVKGTNVIDPGKRPMDANGNPVKEQGGFAAGTKDENPIASMCLQEGVTIQLRLGYSSDPELLDTVFNGVITNIEFSDSEDLIRIVAQSYAVELIQDLKGLTKPKKNTTHGVFGWTFWGLGCAASTGRLLEDLIAEPEVLHFGRWKAESGGATYGRELLTNRWTFYPQPADDNIFAPHPDDDQRLLSDGIIWTELKHVIYRSTIWDVFQEMTLRHPNFIATAVPYKDKYGPRMTMFFGLPNQLYFARAPSGDEEKNDLVATTGKPLNQTTPPPTGPKGGGGIGGTLTDAARLVGGVAQFAGSSWKQAINKASNIPVLGLAYTPLATVVNAVTGGPPQAIQNATNQFFNARMEGALKSGWIKPFRNYHLITSAKHIIANCINANSRDVANVITIQYTAKTITKNAKKAFDATPTGQVAKALSSTETEEESFTLKLDAALPPEETRIQLGKYPNVTNAGLAKRYALGLLLRNLRDIYRGELIIVGNAKIKPYDIVYLIDEYSDMSGPIEVGSVIHVFDQQNGFRTEIKPDLLCAAAEWSLLSSAVEHLAETLDGSLPRGENWHQALLVQMSKEVTGIRPAVISQQTLKRLNEYRGFRHVVRNVYTFHFDEAKLEKLVMGVDDVFTQARAEILAFADFLDAQE